MMVLAVLYMVGCVLWIAVGIFDFILVNDCYLKSGWMILVGGVGLFGVLIGASVCGGFP